MLTGLRCSSRELVTAPAVEPLTVAEVKDRLVIDYDDYNDVLLGLIRTAREYVESYTGRALITQTWKAYYSGLSAALVLPKPKVQSITHIKYYPAGSAAVTVSSSVYEADLSAEPAYITTAYGQQWPSFTARTTKPVEVQFVAGYGGAEDVPQGIKDAMLLLIGHWFRHREEVLVGTTAQISSTPVRMGARYLLDAEYRVMGAE